jgi:hypothetical protein
MKVSAAAIGVNIRARDPRADPEAAGCLCVS